MEINKNRKFLLLAFFTYALIGIGGISKWYYINPNAGIPYLTLSVVGNLMILYMNHEYTKLEEEISNFE